jgi:AcrR family transcriptional regulator
MAEKSKTKLDNLLEAGRKLFWKYGFKRVSIDEICREAGVSRMTFYRFFENKTDLAKTIFANVVADGVIAFNEILNSDAPPAEKLKMIISMKAEGTNDISTEFMTDFYKNPDTELPEFIEKVTREAWDEVITGFRRAQEEGWLRKDFKPEFIFLVSQKLTDLITDKELLKLYNNQQELIMEFANFFTYGIAPTTEK